MSLAELLVTMMLMSLIAILVGTLVTSVSRAFTSDRIANDNTTTAAIAMNEMNRVLRAGTTISVAGQTTGTPVFLKASATSVTLSAFLDTSAAASQPVQVRFELNVATGELSETRWAAIASSKPNWTFVATPTSTRVIARNVTAPTASTPLFAYLKEDASPWPFTSGELTLDARRGVVAVTVSIETQTGPAGKTAPVRIENTIGIPNLSVSRLGL
ncbi:hypothetical protein [Sanguibacter gelidistatuariae]|nr:hypothetical protein [Sanguibacter gelidistatuariae]